MGILMEYTIGERKGIQPQIIARENIQPGDIVLSVGTINPAQTKEQTKAAFEDYDENAYESLEPLLGPVVLAQNMLFHSPSGHADTVHAGVCLGLDHEGMPVITDLHGYVQETLIESYYKPTTLLVFRPNIESKLFVSARKHLLATTSNEEKLRWNTYQNNYEIDRTRYYLPGRMDAKWNVGLQNLLNIAFTSSQNPRAVDVPNKIENKMICSKLVVQIYKIILAQIAKDLNCENDKALFIRNFMNLPDNIPPKTLEGYLTDNINYTAFVVPSEPQLITQLGLQIYKTNNSQLKKLYNTELLDTISNDDRDHHAQITLFAQKAKTLKLTLPTNVAKFFDSQAIRIDQHSKPSHYELAEQYGYSKQLFQILSNSDVLNDAQREKCTDKRLEYEILEKLHKKNQSALLSIDKVKNFYTPGALLLTSIDSLVKTISPSMVFVLNQNLINKTPIEPAPKEESEVSLKL